MIHTVKGFGVVNKAEVDVFLELSCLFDDPTDVGNLISGSLAFSKISLNIWRFTVHVLLKAGLENFEHYFTSNNTNQLQLCIYHLCLEPPSPPHNLPLYVITEHQAGLPVPSSNFPPAMQFAYGRAHMSRPLSPFASLFPGPTVCMRPFSISASPFLPYK